jgi:hypothetical protein
MAKHVPHRCTAECRNSAKLFRERMARENRTEEFDKLIGSYVAGGRTLRYATGDAMRDMGFESLAAELRLHKKAMLAEMFARRSQKRAEYQAKWKAQKKAKLLAAPSSIDAPSADAQPAEPAA